jgi:hypothetical protein
VHLTVSRDSEQEFPQVVAVDLPVASGGTLTPRPTIRAPRRPRPIDIVEEWGLQSFPASDPPANW